MSQRLTLYETVLEVIQDGLLGDTKETAGLVLKALAEEFWEAPNSSFNYVAECIDDELKLLDFRPAG